MSTAIGEEAWFGAGGAEPWADALAEGPAELLLQPEGGPDRLLDVGRWSAEADDADRTVFADLPGPVLDVGCGPGRMIRAALEAGLGALGVDVSAAAAAHCRELGLPVLHRSVFDPLPQEGRWGSVLLIDGNVGIGGDPAALLARCRRLLRRGGALVVETHPEPQRDATYTAVVRAAGGASAPFRWSEVGAEALPAVPGLRRVAAWTAGARRFVRLDAD